MLQYTEYVKYVEYAIHNLGCGAKRYPVMWQYTVDMLGRFTAYTFDLARISMWNISRRLNMVPWVLRDIFSVAVQSARGRTRQDSVIEFYVRAPERL